MRKSKKLPPQTAHNKARGCSPVPVQHFIPHGTCSVTHMDPQVTGKRARDDGRRRDIRDDAAAIADDMATAALSTASSRTKQSEDSTTSVDSSNASCSGSSVIARPRVARVSQARERRASPPCSRPPVIVTADSTDEAAGGASRGKSADDRAHEAFKIYEKVNSFACVRISRALRVGLSLSCTLYIESQFPRLIMSHDDRI